MSETKPVLWNRNFVQCCISYFLMNFAFYMLMPTMPVYLVEELGISTSEVGMVLSSYTIGLLCVRPFSGYLVDCFSGPLPNTGNVRRSLMRKESTVLSFSRMGST